MRHRTFRVVLPASPSSIIEDCRHRGSRRGRVPQASRGWWNMQRDVILLGAVAGIAISFLGCGGSTAVSGSSSTPAIFSISPTSVLAGSGNFPLGITGTGLLMTSMVRFGNDTLSPSSVSAPVNFPAGTASMAQCQTMVVNVPSKDVSSSGIISVSVTNASLVSNSATFN